ncbi:MAG: hypothetical protein J2P17_26240, partial [Mycobacterium sp.]|nr:hypothetical protein [Mycobacterium sp.]
RDAPGGTGAQRTLRLRAVGALGLPVPDGSWLNQASAGVPAPIEPVLGRATSGRSCVTVPTWNEESPFVIGRADAGPTVLGLAAARRACRQEAVQQALGRRMVRDRRFVPNALEPEQSLDNGYSNRPDNHQGDAAKTVRNDEDMFAVGTPGGAVIATLPNRPTSIELRPTLSIG